MHEFDRFVRYQLKPQAYVRYGDDFLLFYPTRRLTHAAKQKAQKFLSHELNLAVNPKNDVVIAARDGLKFLGHTIRQDSLGVDSHTTASILSKVNWGNKASYQSLHLSPEARKQLDWILLKKYVDI